jgi:hypothetical protein
LDLEGVADLFQEDGKGPVIRGLLDPGIGTAVLPKFFKVGFQGIHRILTRALCYAISYWVNSFLKFLLRFPCGALLGTVWGHKKRGLFGPYLIEIIS